MFDTESPMQPDNDPRHELIDQIRSLVGAWLARHEALDDRNEPFKTAELAVEALLVCAEREIGDVFDAEGAPYTNLKRIVAQSRWFNEVLDIYEEGLKDYEEGLKD